jgi:hypothetical protein
VYTRDLCAYTVLAGRRDFGAARQSDARASQRSRDTGTAIVLILMYRTVFAHHTRSCVTQVRKAALVAFHYMAHCKPQLVAANIRAYVPRLYGEAKIKPELIREVDLGPFKHKVGHCARSVIARDHARCCRIRLMTGSSCARRRTSACTRCWPRSVARSTCRRLSLRFSRHSVCDTHTHTRVLTMA